MRGLHTLTFDPSAFDDKDRIVAWMRFFSRISPVVPLQTEPFVPRASVWIAERATFIFAKSHPQSYQSEEALGFNLDQRSMVMAWTCSAGGGQYIHNGKIFSIRPGDVFFLDVAREVQAFMTDAEMYSVIIPHASIGYKPEEHVPHALFRANNPTAEKFKAWVFSKFPELPNARTKDAPEIALEAKTLMRGLLSDANALPDTPPSFPERVVEFVDENIFDPQLDLERLMKQFEISRGQLYELAGFSSGLEQYVRDVRLEYALRSLVFGPRITDRLEIIAERLNYASIAAFSAAFTSHFGFSPEMVLGLLSRERPDLKGKLWDTWINGEQDAH